MNLIVNFAYAGPYLDYSLGPNFAVRRRHAR
jgi:hypothetical protein